MHAYKIQGTTCKVKLSRSSRKSPIQVTRLKSNLLLAYFNVPYSAHRMLSVALFGKNSVSLQLFIQRRFYSENLQKKSININIDLIILSDRSVGGGGFEWVAQYFIAHNYSIFFGESAHSEASRVTYK